MAIYMEYEGINGNVTAAGYEGMIPLDFFTLRSSREITMKTGRQANREMSLPKLGVIETGKRFDRSFPGLIQEAFAGGAGKTVRFHFLRTGEPQLQEYMSFTFCHCLPVFYRQAATSREAGIPAERLYLSYCSVEFSYTASGENHRPGNPVRCGYDLATAASM